MVYLNAADTTFEEWKAMREGAERAKNEENRGDGLIFERESGIFRDVGSPDEDPVESDESSTSTVSGDVVPNNERLSNALHNAESEIKDSRTQEIGVVFGRDGREVYRGEGTIDGIYIPPEHIKDNVVTHNHPSGECKLSPDDIQQIIKYDGYEVRAVTFDGRFVSLKRGQGGWDSALTQKVENLYCNGNFVEYRRMEKRLAIEKYGAQVTPAHRKRAIEEYINEWFRKNAEKYDCIFTEGRI